jgi:PAS domain S-box-containing protein
MEMFMKREANIFRNWPTDISSTTILNSLPNAVFSTDAQMRIIYFNLAAERITGFKSREACGMYCKDVLRTGICETECVVKWALDTGRNFSNIETTIKTASGQTIPALVSASLIRDADGAIVGYLYSFQDISLLKQVMRDLEVSRISLEQKNTELFNALEELKKTEKSLKESEEKLDAMLRSIGDPISMMDKDLNIVWANDIVKKTFDSDIIGRKCYEVHHKRDTPCEPQHCPVFKTFQDGKVHEREARVIDKDGNVVYFHCTANVALRDKDGKPATAIESFRNITENKKIQEQLLHAQKMEAVGQLAGGIAHDFNNILTAMMGYAGLVQMDLRKGGISAVHVNEIIDAAQRAANLTHALLAFSRKQEIDPKPVDLNDVVKVIKGLLSRLIGEDIELIVKVTDEPLTIMADVTQIEQVLMNLVTNARDAMPAGGRLILSTDLMEMTAQFVESHGYGRPGTYALISVEDTGCGMDLKTRERIFEPFFTTKGVGKGTGLGLATAYGTVKQHKGYITVYSHPGKGTIFKIYLPLSRSLAECEKPADSIIVRGGSETILVAEDDIQTRNLIKEVLEKYGYEVIDAKDGEQAIRLFNKNKDKIRLVILDVIMPKKNAKEVYDAIKKVRPEMGAIFMSGYIGNTLQNRGILERGVNFIPKPILPQHLLVKVYEALNNRSAATSKKK